MAIYTTFASGNRDYWAQIFRVTISTREFNICDEDECVEKYLVSNALLSKNDIKLSCLISAKVIVSNKRHMHFKIVVLFVVVDSFVSCVNFSLLLVTWATTISRRYRLHCSQTPTISRNCMYSILLYSRYMGYR